MRPVEAREEWFNIFVIHQNRCDLHEALVLALRPALVFAYRPRRVSDVQRTSNKTRRGTKGPPKSTTTDVTHHSFHLRILTHSCFRVAHSPKNYIHEVMLDNFLNFVVWGHEHECLITPQPSAVAKYYITQPGSSVATALSEGESKKK